MPSAKGKPTDPRLREKVIEEVKAQTNKDGSGKGQMAAWKAAKIGKEYEAHGGDYDNEPGSKDKPKKGPPEKKSAATKAKETKTGTKKGEDEKEDSDSDELSEVPEDKDDANEDKNNDETEDEEPKANKTNKPKKNVTKKGTAKPVGVKKQPAKGERRSARLQSLEGNSEPSSGSADSIPSTEKRKSAGVEDKENEAAKKKAKGKK